VARLSGDFSQQAAKLTSKFCHVHAAIIEKQLLFLIGTPPAL
jgi:hypothetical protein